jgi:AraC family transcriptional activator of pobA
VRFRQAFLPHASSILFNHFVGYSSVPVPPEAAAELDALFGLIRGEVQHGDWSSRSPLRHLLKALVAKIEGWWRRAARIQPRILTDSQRLWERFAKLVEERFRSEHAAGFYARELGVPLRRLNAVARLFAGATTEEALARRLMLEARRLLLFSDLGVGEISFALGFEEHSYFTRVFRKQLGMTPSKFRETNRGGGRGEPTGPESASSSSESVTARRRSELP